MKKIQIFGTACVALLLLGCQKNENGSGETSRALTFYAHVEDPTTVTVTRGIGNSFFQPGYGINVTVTPNYTGQTLPYVYKYGTDGIFRGDPTGYFFPMDDQYIRELTAIWPSEEIRQNGIYTDQSTLENHQFSDWMLAVASVDGVMPTDAPVPLNFVRENTMLEFELAGQNSTGVNITSLIFELEVNGVSTAFQAYCGNDNGHATLILDKNTEISSTENYLIGTLTVSDGGFYYIIFPEMELTLEEGKRYLVTLTPQGYNMVAYVYIAGWNIDEDQGIGIPFSPPTPNLDGTFTIHNPEQLVAMSYLIRHYNDGAVSFEWSSRIYNIDSGFTMTDEQAALYIPVPSADFTGDIRLNGQTILTLPYGTDGILQLYE